MLTTDGNKVHVQVQVQVQSSNALPAGIRK